MSVRFLRVAVRIATQHALLHPQPVSFTAATHRNRRTAHILASAGVWRTGIPLHGSVAPGQHNRQQRCFSQGHEGPRSLQSLAEERRRQGEGEPSESTPRTTCGHRRRQSNDVADDEVPMQRRRSAARTWRDNSHQPSSTRQPTYAEANGDESGSTARPRRQAVQRPWASRSAQPYRRTVAESAAAGVDEEIEQPDSPAARLAKEKALQKAKASAGGMLLRRPHSEAELRTKLTDRGHPEDAIDAAITRLQDLGQQSDREYAAVLARSKWRQSRWAPSRIRMELSRKGLAASDVDAALRDLFGDRMTLELEFSEDVEDRQPTGPDAQFAAEPHLLDATRKQLELSRGLPIDTRRRRVISWLQRRGHSWDTISKLLQQTELARQ